MIISEIFDKYKAELDEDTKLDPFNLKDAQLRLPGVRHKWVGRLMQQKRELSKYKKLKKQTTSKLVEEVKGSTTVDLSNAALTRKVEALPQIENIDVAIEETETIIQYLEKVEVIFRNMTFDIKNVIEIQKLETT